MSPDAFYIISEDSTRSSQSRRRDDYRDDYRDSRRY